MSQVDSAPRPDPAEIRREFLASADLLAECARAGLAEVVAAMAERVVASLAAGGKILAFGNGGSAADAEHLVAEFTGAYLDRSRRALPAVALTVNSAQMTAIANDFGYETVFSRGIEALGRPGDVAFGISTSGNSANVNRALQRARELGLVTLGLAGRGGGAMRPLCDLCFVAPSDHTPRIQEAHIAAIHALCGAAERSLA